MPERHLQRAREHQLIDALRHPSFPELHSIQVAPHDPSGCDSRTGRDRELGIDIFALASLDELFWAFGGGGEGGGTPQCRTVKKNAPGECSEKCAECNGQEAGSSRISKNIVAARRGRFNSTHNRSRPLVPSLAASAPKNSAHTGRRFSRAGDTRPVGACVPPCPRFLSRPTHRRRTPPAPRRRKPRPPSAPHRAPRMPE
jgi:hypothetical protein